MSIKLKIALFNTFLVSTIMICVLIFMMSISNSVIESSIMNQLKYVVHENAEEVEFDDGELELDDIDYYQNHITTLVYSDQGVHLAGYISSLAEFESQPLQQGEVSSVVVEGVQYLIYDCLVEVKRHDDVYLRGIVSVTELSDTVELLFHVTLLALPFFILLAGFGSYHISKSNLKPLEKIVKIAQDISHGDDLSQRIQLGPGQDEVHHLAEAFDTMFSRLEQAFLSEKQFSSDVSHELRTPTAVILAECECMLCGESSEAEKIEALETIQRQGQKMQQLITALLNLIRMDNGVLTANFEPTDLSELVYFVCEEQESLLEGEGRLSTEIQENVQAEVDYGMMIRILSNLIDNAIKYSPDQADIRVCLTADETHFQIQVMDNGMGIPPEEQEKIFQRFYQVSTARTGDTAGSMGLGLSMVAQMVKLQRGEISLESKVNEGSIFQLRFPKKNKK